MNGRPWTRLDDETLRREYPHTPTVDLAAQLNRSLTATYGRARMLGLTKSESYLRDHGGQIRPGERRGIATQYAKGQTPANKGLRRPGWSPGRMSETQFRRGERSGVAAKLWKPIGTERMSKDGYLERKTNNDLPLQARWRAVHLLLWEAANGPLPKGHAIAFRNGNKRDVRLDNLECITRRDLMRRNTIHNLPEPVARTAQLLGALNRQIRKRAGASA